MTIPQATWEADQWELDQCRYCKGPIDDPTEAYCSPACELKWAKRHDQQADNSPGASSVFGSHSIQSSPRSTPASSANSSPALTPTLPSNSVPNLPLEIAPAHDQRRASVYRSHTYGSSHNPIKKSFPSNYYQSTVGERASAQPIFADRSVVLGIRKPSVDESRPKQMSVVETSEKQPSRKASSTTLSSSTTTRGAWSWRRLSTFY
jgi:hypothetical protein